MHGWRVVYGVYVFYQHYFDRLYIGGIVLSGYVLTVLGTVLLSAIVTCVIPNGKTAVLIKSVTKLLCIFAIISPILNYFQNGLDGIFEENLNKSVINTDDTYIDYCSKKAIENAEETLEKRLIEEYELTANVALIWEYCLDETGEKDVIDQSLFGYRIKITSIEITVSETLQIEASVKEEIKEKFEKDYSCGVYFA